MLKYGNAYWLNLRNTYLRIFKIIKEKNCHSRSYNLPCTVGFVRVKPLHFFYVPIVKPPLFSEGFRVSHSRNTHPLSNHWKSDRQKFAVLFGSCFEKPYICPVIV